VVDEFDFGFVEATDEGAEGIYGEGEGAVIFAREGAFEDAYFQAQIFGAVDDFVFGLLPLEIEEAYVEVIEFAFEAGDGPELAIFDCDEADGGWFFDLGANVRLGL
jgi:hypothetical protein